MECDYSIVTGATRKNQKWDMAENEQVLTEGGSFKFRL